MRKEFKLKIPKMLTGDITGEGFRFCKFAALKVVTGLPEGTQECYLVATDELTEDSYRITRPTNRNKYVGGKVVRYRAASLSGIGSTWLYIVVRAKLAKLYAEGYRFVHVEYDD